MIRLSENKAAFVRELIDNDFNATAAYVKVYDQKNKNAAAVEACKLLKEDKILVAIEIEIGSNKEISWKEGLDRRKVMKALREIILDKVPLLDDKGKVVKDENGKVIKVGHSDKSIISAINTLAKLTGDFSPEKMDVKWKTDDDGEDLSKLSEEELKKRRIRIINELNK